MNNTFEQSELPDNACETLAQKHDQNKPRWDLIPWRCLEQIVNVLTYGAKKYSADNWKYIEHARDRYFSAAMRHISAWRNGEGSDIESGLPHLAHAICCLLFILWFDENGN